jgi:hypothetical protein
MTRRNARDATSTRRKLDLKEVMDRVDRVLASIPVEGLKEFIKQMARDLQPGERESFVANIEAHANAIPDPPQEWETDESLLDDIGELSSKVESGELCDGYGWDPEIKDERDFGDESWSGDVDDFLTRARDEAVHGNPRIARDAYDAIFSILEMAEEAGHLPGPPDPQDLLETDMDEARALYLRATYLTSSKEERPAAIMDALQRFGYLIGDKYNVAAMRGAGEADLPSFGEFLADWITYLEKPGHVTTGAHTWKDSEQYLLREATTLLHGVPGIADLARTHGKKHPKAFIDWIEQLEGSGDVEGTIAAAKEGLTSIPVDLVDRAIVGEHLVKAAGTTGNKELQLAGWKAAFESAPSIERLASFIEVAASLGVQDLEIKLAIDRLRQLLAQEHPNVEDAGDEASTRSRCNVPLILCQSLFMVGDLEAGFEFLKQHASRTAGHHGVGSFGIAYLLKSLVGGNMNEHTTPNLHALWREALAGMLRVTRITGTPAKSNVEVAFDAAVPDGRIKPAMEQELVVWCKEAISAHVDGIVGNQDRYDYPVAARLACAFAEALQALARQAEATAFLDSILKKYSRHRLFIQSIARARGVAGD